jgi:hypothetical protein
MRRFERREGDLGNLRGHGWRLACHPFAGWHRCRPGGFAGGKRFRSGRLVAELFLEVFGGDLVEGAGGNPGIRDAEILGFGKDDLAFDAKLLGYVINANGHIRVRTRCGGNLGFGRPSFRPRPRTLIAPLRGSP